MSIATRIEALEQHLTDDYSVLELAGADLTNVDKNIVNLKQQWKERLLYFLANGTDVVWNNWLPKVTGTGETITLNNTIEAKMDFVYKGNTSQKTTTGKNLFNYAYYKNQEIYTETISISTGNLYCTKLYLKPNTTYTINEVLNNWSLSGGWIFAVADTNNQIIRYLQNRPQDYQTTPTTFTTNSDGYIYIGHRYGFSSGGATRMLAFLDETDIQIEEGSQATNFEEYTGGIPSPNPDYTQTIQLVTGNNSIKVANSDNTQSQTYPINIGNIELCKIENYQDYIYKNNDKWYLHKEIGKVVLNGNESWVKYGLYGSNSYLFYVDNQTDALLPDNTKIGNGFGLSNYFAWTNKGDSTAIAPYVRFQYNNGKRIYFAIINDLSLGDWKTWLSSHNTTVYYVLSTSTNTEITDKTLLYQLETIKKSYNNQTNISQTNVDKPFILDATALGVN